jgi:hypothetical protein
MKKSTFILIILTLFLAFKDNTASVNAKPIDDIKPSIEGTWELIMRYNYDSGIVVDSFSNDESYHQIKMFTKNKVMWTRHLSLDSTDWFGYGSYKLNGSDLSENLDYGSKTMQKAISNNTEFKFEIELSDDYLNAIQIDEEGNPFFSEKYKRIE